QGIWVGTLGEADTGVPMEPDMRLGIASNSKAITAALILRLQDEGLISLEDRVSDYLDPHPHVDGDITLRQLMIHTSGLFDFLNDWTTATQNEYNADLNRNWTMEEILATIGPPLFSPGERHSYSNTNYLLLGMIAEAATEMDIRDLLHQYVFDPLDVDMAYPPTDDVFADAYADLFVGGDFDLNPGQEATFLSFTATAGAVWATPYDMVRWYAALFGGDFLGQQGQMDLLGKDGAVAYGMGVRLQNTAGRSLYYHAGAWGYRSYNIYDPSTGISLCVITNQQGQSVGTLALNLLETVLDERPSLEVDLQVVEINPRGNDCTDPFAPEVLIRNTGTSELGAFTLMSRIDEGPSDTSTVNLLVPLAVGEELWLPLPTTTAPADQQRHRLYAEVSSQPY
ncbi:MAG: serine hydrolase domain-containing protein, partial [Bacteroidota bacterium]